MMATAPKRHHSGLRREQTLTYMAFILRGIDYSLMDQNGISPHDDFVGLKNDLPLLTDKKLRAALVFNLCYTVMLVMGIVVISVILALLRTVSLVFKQLVFYVLPAVGKALGIAALSTSILASKQLSIYGWLFVRLWQGAALPILLFLGGLQAIPSELYEAWGIDCANAWQQFKSITVAYLIRSPGALLILFPIYITLPNSLFLVNYISVLQDQKLYYAYGSTLLTTAMPLVGSGFSCLPWAMRCRAPWAAARCSGGSTSSSCPGRGA